METQLQQLVFTDEALHVVLSFRTESIFKINAHSLTKKKDYLINNLFR